VCCFTNQVPGEVRSGMILCTTLQSVASPFTSEPPGEDPSAMRPCATAGVSFLAAVALLMRIVVR
jgi:hypothetical protein